MNVNEKALVETVLVVLDLGGTFVFALSGGMAGVKHRLDLFGVLVLSFVAATAGGITRDLLIGATPPAAIADWRYIAVSGAAGIVTFFWHRSISRLRGSVQVFDAVGLALFAVAGAQKALAYDLGPVGAVLLGGLTGIGGGMARDLLVSEVPTVFRAELYAVTALAGALVVVGGRAVDLPHAPVALAGAALCFGLRIMAIQSRWHLPTAEPGPRERD